MCNITGLRQYAFFMILFVCESDAFVFILEMKLSMRVKARKLSLRVDGDCVGRMTQTRWQIDAAFNMHILR